MMKKNFLSTKFLNWRTSLLLMFFLTAVCYGQSDCGASGTLCYDNNLSNSVLGSWEADDPNDLITIEFTSGAVESCCDFFTVYEGVGTSGSVIESNVTGGLTGRSFTATGAITVAATSDVSVSCGAGSVSTPAANYTISCSAPPSCPVPANVAVSDITSSGVQMDWDSVSEASDGYQWFIVPEGEPVSSFIVSGTGPSSATTDSFNGLTPNTSYDVYVRAICSSEGDFSDFSSPINFSTLCEASSIPWSENFDGLATGTTGDGNVPNCWETSNNAGGPITAANSVGSSPNTITPLSGSTFIWHRWSSNNDIYTPGFDFVASESYRFSFNYRESHGSSGHTVTVYAGTTPDVASMTSVGTITNPTNTSWEEFFVDYEAPTSDTYFFAINITSTGAPWYLGFDEFSVTESPDCLTPLNLTASDITNDSVNLSWDAEATALEGYEWVIMPQGVAADPSTAVAGTTTTFLTEGVSGLAANTAYSAYVRSECSMSEFSFWSSAVNFTTLCDPVSDFSEDFNFIGTGNMPDCWNTIIQTGSTFSSIGVSSFEDFTLPNAVRMSNGFTTSGDMIAVSPPLSTLGDGTYWLKLDAVATNASNNLIIGTLSDPNDAATFTPLETLDLSTSLQSFEVLFTSYTGSDNYIGFKRELTTTSNSVYFDNVVWEVAPTCFPPTNLSVSNITSNSVDLSWDAEPSLVIEGFEWVIMPQGEAADLSTAVATATSNALSENVTGLDSNTNYSVYVRSECDPGEFSAWSSAVNFTTDCAAFALNFEEDFAAFGSNFNTDVNSECWAEGTGFFDTVANGAWSQQNFVNQVSHPNGRSLYVNLYSSTPRQDWVTTPAIDLGSGSSDYVLSYDVYAAPWSNPATAQLTSFGNHSVEVYISTDNGSTWTDLITTYDDSNNPNDINDTEEVFSLASYTGEIKIGFLAHQDGTDVDIRFYIDNLFVGTPPTCFPPDITSSFGTATQISTDWPDEATATDGYNWFLMAAGENPVDDTPLQSGSVATNALTVSDLTPNTAYDIYVQSNCGGGNLSTFTVLSRTTPALEASPWTEGFDGTSNPIGWNITGWQRANSIPVGGGGAIEGRDGSNVIRRNLWSSAPNGFIETVNVGPIQAGDYLSYEYNVRNYGTQAPNPVPDGACTFTLTGSFSTSGSVILQSFSNDDKLGWQKKYIDLSDYVGETVQISMLASWNTGDFWIYFDNFAVKNVDGYVYADDVQGWLTGTPVGVSTIADVIEVVEGNATFGGDVEADELVVFAQASLDIEDVLDLDGELYTDGEVTFKSSLTKTGQLASASQVRGQVTTERFVPAGTNASRGFRFITPTVDGGSIFNNWQEGGNSPAGFGTHITGSTTGANGFDATATGNPSLFVFDNDAPTQAGGVAWVPASNTNANLVAGTPYRIFVRGDRSIDLTETNPTPNNTVLRAKGNLVVGNRTTATFAGDDLQFSFFGNPYQAIVNLNNVTFNGDVNPNYAYVWDINSGTSGSYVTVEISSGTNTMSSNANNLLQPGQAVFIRNNSSVTTAPSIEFTQASKQVSGSQLTTFATPDYSVLNVQLISPNSNGLVLDGIGMRFDDSFNNEVGDEDAGKIGNSGENMAIVRSNQLLSIERRNFPLQGESHQLFVNNLQQQSYALRLMTENYTSDLDVIVVDNYLGTETLITEGNDYTFTAQPNVPESVSPFRFQLKFDIISLGSENQLAQNISLYPVPVNNVLNIQYINDSKLSVEVINLLGQVVTRANVEGGNLHQIDMSELASGVYVVKISSENETFTQQVIKK